MYRDFKMCLRRIGSIGLAAATLTIAGCQGGGDSGGPVLVQVQPPAQIDAVEVGDADSAEPIGDAQTPGPSPDVSYEFADDLALPTNDSGYVYRSGGSVDAEVIDRLAAYFELDPATVQNWDDLADVQPDESDLESDQVVTAGLGYSPSEALQQWTYADYELSNPYRNCQPPDTGGPLGSDPVFSGENPDFCVPPKPIGSPPTGPEAEAKLGGMLDQIGVEHGELLFQTYADEYTASTNAVELDQGGLRTGREWTASYGADGVVITATGPFAVPERVGPYDLVDLDTAKQRVVSGANSFGPMGTAGTDDGVGSVETSGATTSDGEVVRIVAVDADLFWIWDAENTAWLVPGYSFRDANDGVWAVPAVPDELFTTPPTPTSDA